MFSSVGPTNGRNGTAAGDEELIRVADMVLGLRTRQHKLIKVQSELADIPVHLVDRELATARSLVIVRMLWAHKIRAILTHHMSTSGHDCKGGGRKLIQRSIPQTK